MLLKVAAVIALVFLALFLWRVVLRGRKKGD